MARSRSAVAMAVTAAVLLMAMATMMPSASAACGNVQTLASCISSASTGSVPPQSCCSAVAAFTQGGTPEGQDCLCKAMSTTAAQAAGAKVQYAVQIPQKCNLNYKAGYVCNGTPVPGGHA